jgi:hypothetical protein
MNLRYRRYRGERGMGIGLGVNSGSSSN